MQTPPIGLDDKPCRETCAVAAAAAAAAAAEEAAVNRQMGCWLMNFFGSVGLLT
jgi:hypothetical protein